MELNLTNLHFRFEVKFILLPKPLAQFNIMNLLRAIRFVRAEYLHRCVIGINQCKRIVLQHRPVFFHTVWIKDVFNSICRSILILYICIDISV